MNFILYIYTFPVLMRFSFLSLIVKHFVKSDRYKSIIDHFSDF